MSPWKTLRLSLAPMAVVSLAAAAYALGAQDAKKPQPALSPEQQKEMEAWMAIAKPGKEHEAMKRMEGTFDVQVEMVMQPGMPAEKSTGKQTAKMIMGGRYLAADYTGEAMGQPFHGASLTGYDNLKKKHFGAWIDDMSTGMMLAEGTASPDGKVITLHGEYTDPMNKKHKYRWVTTIDSDDRYTFDWFDADETGRGEYRMLHNTYTRAK
jgi:hypothetical protein